MNIVILGAGALGSVLGGLMAKSELPVTLLDVDDAHIRAINENGLILHHDDEASRLEVPSMRPENYTGQADLIILLTKTMHTTSALASVEPLIRSGARILTIQNGLGNADRVAQSVPENCILEGSTMINGRMLGPGEVATNAASKTTFRAISASSDGFARDLGDYLRPVGFVHDPAANVVIWQKAAFNCAMNAIGALGNARVGDIARQPDAIALARSASAEVVAVANAKGISASLDAVHAQIDKALAEHGPHKPSMLQDLEAGRATEIESLCGTVEREAKSIGIDAPLNAALAALIRLRESAASADWS
ncbi:ketopantoate reductase family protein [Roseibium sp.]|uniref:ketopantoate reductase family protein n=1 Tax=Roseibium sp. TaxID=1936156 RepID=UPI003A979B7F